MTQRAKESIQGCFRKLVAELVGHPEELRIQIDEKPIGMSVGLVVSIDVHQTDFRRVIGAGGVTFRALIALAAQISSLHGVQVRLAPVGDTAAQAATYVAKRKPDKPEEPKIEFEPNCNWPGAKPQIEKIAILCAGQLFGDPHPRIEFQDATRNRTFLRMKVQLSGRMTEPAQRAAEALVVLFDRCCRKHGRIIELELQVTEDPSESQPSNTGRYTQ